jgi:hypothetical protein
MTRQSLKKILDYDYDCNENVFNVSATTVAATSMVLDRNSPHIKDRKVLHSCIWVQLSTI